MSKALDGTNVVEFSSHPAAAYAAMLLAEQGAETVKIEAPGGAPGRGTPHFHVLNRSKRSAVLDLAGRAGHEKARAFIKWADVVITGWTTKRLLAVGLDYPSIQGVNPGAVALSMPPFGSRGPLAELDADDQLVSALGGIAGDQWARSGDPVAMTFPAASYSAGILGATAATAAILARRNGGLGQQVEVSMLAGAFSLQTGALVRHEEMIPLFGGPQDPLGPIPCYRLFRTSDGHYLFIACGNQTFWNKLALAIGRPDLVADPRFDNAPWGILPKHRQALKDILVPVIAARPRDEWLRILRENDIPCAPVMTRHQFIEDVQVRSLNMRREVNDPVLGPTVQPGIPVVLNETPGDIVGPAPTISNDGANERQLPESMHRTDKRADAAPQARSLNRGPLSDILVLDFCSYIAGSYGPMILAQMGAQIIKIESVEGDSFRNFGFGFLGWNQGKRGLALNLNTPEGRDIIYGLAEKADIVVENLRPGRMSRFGFDYETLAKINRRLIYMSINGFGNQGPEHNQPGFDPLLQARSGVMAAQGGPHGHPVYLTCAICDYGAAMLSALGCLLALSARRRTGCGQLCETSLLQAAMAMQAGEFAFYRGRPDMENGSPEYRGPSALCRAYQCRAGGWLFISIFEPRQWDAFRALCAGLGPIPYETAVNAPNEGEIAAVLEGEFAKLDRADALDALSSAGVPSVPVHCFEHLFGDEQVRANDLVIELEHSHWGQITQSGILAKFSATPGRVECAAPLLGEHTNEILTQYLGYDATRIADLRRRQIVK